MTGRVMGQGAVAAALWVAAMVPAAAQSKLEARYSAKLAGITVGTGVWVVDIADDQYSAAVTGRATGLLRVFASGEGSGAVRGKVLKGALIPASYAATISSEKKTDEVRIAITNGLSVRAVTARLRALERHGYVESRGDSAASLEIRQTPSTVDNAKWAAAGREGSDRE